MTDDDFESDLDEIVSNIDSAEVISIFLPTLRRSVVIDTRTNEHDGAMVRLMPMVASPQERLRSLRRLRPSFPRVHNLALIPWLRYVESLVKLGVWTRVVSRLEAAGQDAAASECGEVLRELQAVEKAEMASVVRGENYHTIWSAGS